MKITQVDLYQVEIPLIPAIAKYTQKIYDITICRMRTDEGLSGIGETAVYQLGCGIAPNDPLPLAARAPTGECGLLNPSFEHFAIAG